MNDISQLPDSVRARTHIDPDTGCWLHTKGARAITRIAGHRQLLGKLVWDLYHPDDPCNYEPAGSMTGDSVRAGKDCDHRCINPDHLTKMSTVERIQTGQDSHRRSEYLGVIYHAANNQWTCRLMVDGVTYSGGYYTTQAEAAIRFDQLVTALAPERPTNYSTGRMPVVPVARGPVVHEKASRYKGVLRVKNRWVARGYDPDSRKQVHLGSFEDEDEAGAAYQKWAVGA